MICYNPDIKCSLVERVHRTLGQRLWRYFTQHNTFRWIEILPKITLAYNNTYHRTIKDKPANINSDNEHILRKRLYGFSNTVMPKFKINDRVRITGGKKIFTKARYGNWSIEEFIICEVIRTNPPTYKIKDHNGEEVESIFYETELQLSHKTDKDIFKINNNKDYKDKEFP